MATLEATPSPEKKPSPVPTGGGPEVERDMPCKLGEAEPKEAEKHQLQDRQTGKIPVESKKEPLTGQAGLPHFKQSSASPSGGEEIPSGSAESLISSSKDTERRHGRKFWHFSLPKFLRRGQSEQQPLAGSAAKYVVQSPTQSPSGKSKSFQVSPSPQSQKSPSSLRSPRGVPGQKVDVSRMFVRSVQIGSRKVSKEVQSASSLIRLVNITDKDVLPRELVDVSCHENGFVPIVYDNQYNIQSTSSLMLPWNQTFLINKPDSVFEKLRRQLNDKFIQWKVDVSWLYDISDYVSPYIKQGDVEEIAELMDLVLPNPTPSWESFSSVVLRPLRIQAMGSIVACKLALEEGWAINIGGGFSHYTANIGGGLAVYDDVLLCLAVISNFQNVRHIGVINLDAYQSSSYQYAKNVNCNVTILDIYSEMIVESAEDVSGGVRNDKVSYYGFDATLDLKTGTFNEYLNYVTKLITKYIGDDQIIKPSLCIYVGGTTVLAVNPHTKLNFTAKDVIERDKRVFKLITSLYNIPIAILMGGGYQIYDANTAATSIQTLLTDIQCAS